MISKRNLSKTRRYSMKQKIHLSKSLKKFQCLQNLTKKAVHREKFPRFLRKNLKVRVKRKFTSQLQKSPKVWAGILSSDLKPACRHEGRVGESQDHGS